jgi:hypothetical protein
VSINFRFCSAFENPLVTSGNLEIALLRFREHKCKEVITFNVLARHKTAAS